MQAGRRRSEKAAVAWVRYPWDLFCPPALSAAFPRSQAPPRGPLTQEPRNRPGYRNSGLPHSIAAADRFGAEPPGRYSPGPRYPGEEPMSGVKSGGYAPAHAGCSLRAAEVDGVALGGPEDEEGKPRQAGETRRGELRTRWKPWEARRAR